MCILGSWVHWHICGPWCILGVGVWSCGKPDCRSIPDKNRDLHELCRIQDPYLLTAKVKTKDKKQGWRVILEEGSEYHQNWNELKRKLMLESQMFWFPCLTFWTGIFLFTASFILAEPHAHTLKIIRLSHQ